MEITNKIAGNDLRELLFPVLHNKSEVDVINRLITEDKITNVDAQGNTISTSALWQTVASRWVDKVRKIIAPVSDFVTDVYEDLQVPNPNALPVVKVEVINSVGNALINTTDWTQSAVDNTYVNVEMNRVSRPFVLTTYDLARGERIESKVAAAMETVAQGVFNLCMSAITTAVTTPDAEAAMTPAVAASISAAFGANAETDTLLLDPVAYSSLVPTNTFSLNPDASGAFGIRKIHKTLLPSGVNGIATAIGGLVGAVGTPQTIQGHAGVEVRPLGTIAGIPMLLKSHFGYDGETIKCSVEALAGFTVADSARLKTYTFGATGGSDSGETGGSDSGETGETS